MGYAIKSFTQEQLTGGTPCCRQRLQTYTKPLERSSIWRLTPGRRNAASKPFSNLSGLTIYLLHKAQITAPNVSKAKGSRTEEKIEEKRLPSSSKELLGCHAPHIKIIPPSKWNGIDSTMSHSRSLHLSEFI